MARTVKTKIVRISEDMDKQIRNLANSNKIKYVDASRELAKINLSLTSRKLFKEVKF